MKILITTMHRGLNYGSALQVYALSEVLKKLNHTPIILDYIPKRIKTSVVFNSHLATLACIHSNIYQKYNALRGVLILIISNYQYGRFFKKHLHLTQKIYTTEGIEDKIPPVDVYMTGSDQVWNSTHNQGIDKFFFLDFLPENAKRIAYAASFGKSELDPWEIEETQTLLKRYQTISVREKSGLNILQSLGISNGQHVLDPTLLLDKEEWEKKCLPLNIKEKYVLIYSVESNKNKLIEYAKSIAKALNLKIYMVEWGVKKHPGVDKMICNISPLTLMSYFIQADYIVASSFHGTAFSINLNKPFISVAPERFNTRVDSLLAATKLEDRLIKDNGFNLTKALEPINYIQVNNRMQEQRKHSYSFLTTAITL